MTSDATPTRPRTGKRSLFFRTTVQVNWRWTSLRFAMDGSAR